MYCKTHCHNYNIIIKISILIILYYCMDVIMLLQIKVVTWLS